MGFSSEWVSIMKEAAPAAFTPNPDTPNLRGVFIDGQIQLMKGQHVVTMEMFYRLQFANPVNRYFHDGPDDLVVVVAFDNYNFVPPSKSMTQCKRKQKVKEIMPFTETDSLPQNACPVNWDSAMCNRTFKTKLIKSIVEKLGEYVILRKKQKLIVDFWGNPLEYSCMPGGTRMPNTKCVCFASELSNAMTGLQDFDLGIGEADCKFPRWVSYIASLHPGVAIDVIIEATDSDYIAIAMMHYEFMSTHQHPLESLGRVSIRRIQGKVGNKRTMEFVHIPLLTEVMTFQLNKMFEIPEEGSTIASLVCLIGLNGTDFCRGLPRIGAKRLWEWLQVIRRENGKDNKLKLFKGEKTEEYDEDLLCDNIMTKVYKKVFSNHLFGCNGTSFDSLARRIKSPDCSLSEKIKGEFPDVQMLTTTIRNVSWTLAYWWCAATNTMKDCPDPMQVKYGYILDGKGKPQWLDVALKEAKRPRLN